MINNKTIGIYKILSPTGKVYIGQSWNIEDRFRRYKRLHCKTQIKLYNSFNKYGSFSHLFEIIVEFPKDIKQNILDSYEILYINQYRECGIELMNIREGGSKGKLSEETKQKIRDRDHSYKIGLKQSPETIEKRVSQIRGRKDTDQQRLNKSISKKGIKFSDEHKLNLRGKIFTDAHKEKLKLAKVGNKASDKTKLLMSLSAKSGWEKRRLKCL